ncbi:TetR/AcrR family transcriptional regulator [Paenibacillus soyae]|uniref:TetR/AcrR family transcriptional regulator n=1 Tax=Paenibacillus soyae TaxID=2969249 RepID=A0A9X2SD76_9BACL|nr:TetR/AcrR family transcriptional regulator [Paenibacillus soyae]MCR2807593.1 TetR/AcrR family transcriptional regulator [Paenibacillus soyae]
MARPREFDEREALTAAMQVFWEKGYEATSIGDLTARMNIQRPSLYAAFGGKEELFEAALRAYSQMSLAYVERMLGSGESTKAALQAFLQGIIDGPGGGNPSYGCLCVNTMVELGPHEPKFAAITNDYQAKLTDLFREAVERGVRSGELPARLNPALIASVLSVTAIGLSVSMKSNTERSRVEPVIKEILTLIE